MALLKRHPHYESGLSAHWLVKDGTVLASLEVAETRRARLRGLLGRDGLEGAMLFPSTRSVHTIGMRFGLDVAFLDDGNTVLRVTSLSPRRIGGVHLRASSILEAERGAFERWGIEPGDTLEISEECE